MLVIEVGWDEEGMCGQWSQKQDNAYKNNTRSKVVVVEKREKREKREKKRRVVCLSTMAGQTRR